MTDRKALAREIAKRKPARFVAVKAARMKRTMVEGEPGRPALAGGASRNAERTDGGYRVRNS
jgi:hypothetical protein